MYQASEKLHAAILGDKRSFLAKIKVGNNEISSGIISIRYNAYASENQVFTVGGTASAYIEVSMWDSGVEVEGQELEISIGMNIDGIVEYVPLGLFTAQMPSDDDGVLSFVAYDRIQAKMSGAYFSNLSYPVDAKKALAEISEMSGVPIDTSSLPDGVVLELKVKAVETDIDEDGNEKEVITYTEPFNGYTYRESLGYIAELYNKYAIADRGGTVVFKWFSDSDGSVNVTKISQPLFYYDAALNIVRTDANYEVSDGYLLIKDSVTYGEGASEIFYENDYVIKTNRYYDDLVLNSPVFSVSGLICQNESTNIISGNEFGNVEFSNPAMNQTLLDGIYASVKNIEFVPASVSFMGDMCLDICDVVRVVSKRGYEVNIPILGMVIDFDGGLLSTVYSYGASEDGSTGTSGPLAKAVERTYAELFFVKELVGKKASFEYVYSIDAEFKRVSADYANFREVTTVSITATNAELETVKSDYGSFKQLATDKFVAVDGEFETVKAEQAQFEQVVINSFSAMRGDFDELNADYSSFKVVVTDSIDAIEGEFDVLETKYAAIDFANIAEGTIKTAMIGDAQISSAKIKDVNADVITSGTLSVERLIIRGSEKSLIYQINNINGALQADNYDTINGEIITKRTIDADKIIANSITTDELATDAVKSNNYVYSSGNFSESGTFIDLASSIIRTKGFAVDASGNVYLKGAIDATSLSAKEDIKVYSSDSSDYESVIKAKDWDNNYKTVLFGFSDSNDSFIQIETSIAASGGHITLGGETTDVILNGYITQVNNDLYVLGSIYENGELLENKYAKTFDLQDYLPLTGGTVTGQLILSKTTDGGAAASDSALIIGSQTGQHLLFDGNEIMSKKDATTAGVLYLNLDGGNVGLSGNALVASKDGVDDTTAYLALADGSTSTFYVNGKARVQTTAAAQISMYVGNSAAGASINVSAAGVAGLYSSTHSKWMIRTDESGTVTVTTSDRRAKNDIGLIPRDETLIILREVKNHKYTYLIDESNVVQYGIFAQDLRDVLINHGIGYRSILQIDSLDGEQSYKDLSTPEDMVQYSIDYSKMVPLLHDGWQYHDEKIIAIDSITSDLKMELLSIYKEFEYIKTKHVNCEAKISDMETLLFRLLTELKNSR